MIPIAAIRTAVFGHVSAGPVLRLFVKKENLPRIPGLILPFLSAFGAYVLPAAVLDVPVDILLPYRLFRDRAF